MNELLRIITTLLVVLFTSVSFAQTHQPGIPVFDSKEFTSFIRANNTDLSIIQFKDKPALKVIYSNDADWPNVFFDARDSHWDWSQYSGIAVELHNPGTESVTVSMRVDNKGANGTDHCNNTYQLVPPGATKTLNLYFSSKDKDLFWGMRGIPILGPVGNGPVLDLTKIVAWQLYLNRPESKHTIIVCSAKLIGEGGDLAERVPFPFIDSYGQYKYTDWEGKIIKDADFQKQHQTERNKRSKTKPESLDRYGGWVDGPQLEKTGWFRTTKINGKQWLVTPDGHLFFSLGVDCVGTWSRTFIEGRSEWFDGLPDPDDETFKKAYGYADGSHSMAETIDGKGKTFSFYTANLIRKFGSDWNQQWIDNSLARLKDWGFNTIGNWSQWDILQVSDVPFVVNMNLTGVRPIESASGYWAKMMDVYDSSFAKAVESTVSNSTKRWRDNRFCLGYFVDNELAWEGVINGVLTSKSDQPVRQAFIKELKDQYKTISALNESWKTDFENWSNIKSVNNQNAAMTRDLEHFLFTFAKVYYRTITDAFRKHAPNQLYLGSRFSGAPKPVVRACAEFADVISFNIYAKSVDKRKWDEISELNKPIMIGEFHFGATDRGMFHTGLVPVETQADRAKAYENYVLSVVDHPAFVGCHWFQYVDEPTTGRTHDGENYNIGFVDVTDVPYPHMVEVAKKIHRTVYERRFNKE